MCDCWKNTRGSSLSSLCSRISSTGGCRSTSGCWFQNFFLGIEICTGGKSRLSGYSLILSCALQLFLGSCDSGCITRLFSPIYLVSRCFCCLYSRYCRLFCSLHLSVGCFYVCAHSFQRGSSTWALCCHLCLQSTYINSALCAKIRFLQSKPLFYREYTQSSSLIALWACGKSQVGKILLLLCCKQLCDSGDLKLFLEIWKLISCKLCLESGHVSLLCSCHCSCLSSYLSTHSSLQFHQADLCLACCVIQESHACITLCHQSIEYDGSFHRSIAYCYSFEYANDLLVVLNQVSSRSDSISKHILILLTYVIKHTIPGIL